MMNNNLPQGWEEVKISDVSEVLSGGTPSTKNELFYNGNIGWITPKDLSGYEKKYIKKGSRSITNFGLEKSSAKLLPKGTVLLSSRAPIGYLAIADTELTTNQGFKNIVCKEDILHNIFIYYYFKHKKDDLEQVASGSTFKEVSGTTLKNFKIKIPTDINEQKRIADILSAFDDKIELNNQMNRTLESMATVLFKEWFLENQKKEWKRKTLDYFGKVITGKTPSTKNSDYWGNNTCFITPTDFKNYSKYAFDSERKLSRVGKESVNRILLPKESILVTCIGSDMGKVVITKNECVSNQQINAIILKDLNYQEYIYQYLRYLYPHLRLIAMGGSTMPIINKSSFENIEIALPPLELIERFQLLIDSFNAVIEKNIIENQTLKKQRDTLLLKLMSGEIRV